MHKRNVVLGRTARELAVNPDTLIKKAEALAASLTLPQDVEFARFDHAGKTYALSARVLVEVEMLASRVPDVVIRRGTTDASRRRR